MKNRGRGERYRHFVPAISLSIEKNTGNVPNDGKFYLVKAGMVIQSFRSRRLAEERFRQMLVESGYRPEWKPSKSINPLDESMERFFTSKEVFWAEGPKSMKKGGKGGRGGV